MTHIYFFPEAGTISGIPGTFAGVQVEVDEEKSEIVKVSPLARHPHFQASQEPGVPPSETEKPAEQETELASQEKPPEQPEQTEAAPSELPPEQAASTEAPTNVASPTDEASSHTESEEA